MNRDLVIKWLYLCCLFIILMIMLGGATRLTDSGLSIVEWQPIAGIIPPLTNNDWQLEFAKYQEFPEYQAHNLGMSLRQFKHIYLLEYVHRLFGRITGLLYILPLIYFCLNRAIKKSSLTPYISVTLLFFIQGFMGWYMVKSGLIAAPFVNHFRLAFHLIIAVIMYHLLFYQLMKNSFDILLIPTQIELKVPARLCLLSIIIVYLQIFLGALVAGLDAGLVYNSFPLMGDYFVPAEIKDNFLNNFVNVKNWSDPVFIQFLHRLGAYCVLIIVSLLIYNLLKIRHPKLNKISYILIATLLIQLLTGIITILYSIPILVALLHQIFAIILLSVIIWCYFLIRKA